MKLVGRVPSPGVNFQVSGQNPSHLTSTATLRTTPTALRPIAQGWPRNEAYPGSPSHTQPNRNAVVAGPALLTPVGMPAPSTAFQGPADPN